MADLLLNHLLRRTGFGASSDDLAIFSKLSYSQAVDRLVNYQSIADDVDTHIGQSGYAGTTSSGAFSPNTVIADARQRWLFRMLHTQRPLQEKMALFWHNYFATGFTKIAGVVGSDNATRLLNAKPSEDGVQHQGQIEFFRLHATGNLRKLLGGMATDPAMLIWLDGNTNTKAKPQENFGRELMELFSRGVGYYTEDDVYAAARVFTGWNLRTVAGTPPAYSFIYNASQHETTSKTFSFPIYRDGTKTIPARAAADGQQDGIDLITALASHPETARRVAGKLYQFFVSETDTDAGFIGELANVYLQSDTNMAPVLTYLFNAPQFKDASKYFTRYSWPVEFVVRAMKETGWSGFSLSTTLSPLSNMGQVLFEPPDVAGWDLGTNWFSTSAMLARMNFGATLSANQKFNLATAAANAGARSSPQALLDYLLGRMTIDADTDVSSALSSYAGAGITWSGSDAQLQSKGPGLVHLILASPEYQFL